MCVVTVCIRTVQEFKQTGSTMANTEKRQRTHRNNNENTRRKRLTQCRRDDRAIDARDIRERERRREGEKVEGVSAACDFVAVSDPLKKKKLDTSEARSIMYADGILCR